MYVVVFIAMLLDGDVGQVDVHVVHLTHGVVVLNRTEPPEAVLVQVNLINSKLILLVEIWKQFPHDI